MKKTLYLATLLATGALACPTCPSHAEEGKGKKEEGQVKGHCEKKEKNGEITDLNVNSREECKQQGGKWSKKPKGDHHQHDDKKEGDHKH